MSFQEPNPETLIAYSGWAISKKSGASDEQTIALSKFQDGCESLSKCCPSSTVPIEVQHDPEPKRPGPPEQMIVPSQVADIIPKEVIAAMGVNVSESGQCKHRFHIATQRCVYCGQTYLQAKGRLPELM